MAAANAVWVSTCLFVKKRICRGMVGGTVYQLRVLCYPLFEIYIENV